MSKKAYYEYLPVFERNIIMGNCFEAIRKKACEYYREEDMELYSLDDNENCYGLATSIDSRIDHGRVLFFIMYVSDRADIGTVAHEATHVCNQIFSYIGQMADQDNDEADAYLVGHLTKVFMEEIRGIKRMPRKLVKGAKSDNLGR